MLPGQPDLVAKLSGIEIRGLKERHFDLSADTFVTVSVDGEQQLQTPVVENDLNPTWSFNPPFGLMVHASSIISFQVYRRRNVAKVLGDKYIGELEQKLYTFVTNPNTPFDMKIRMNTMQWEKAELTANIEVDYNTSAEDFLDHAEARMQEAMTKASNKDLTPTAEALKALGHAIGSLDQLMGFVDGIVDIHPIAKAAWMLLSSAYKAFKSYSAQDRAVRELAGSIRDTLTNVKFCRNVQNIPGAKLVVQELARLTAEGASLLDECMKHSAIVRVAKAASSKALPNRIADCDQRLKKLSERLVVVLVVDIHNYVAEPHDPQERPLQTPPTAAVPTPSPRPNPTSTRPTAQVFSPGPSSHRTSQSNDVNSIGHSYQPIYITSPWTYHVPQLPVRATSPVPIYSAERTGPATRPASSWLPPLDTGYVRSQSPMPMPPLSQPFHVDLSPPTLQRPFPMPSPSSSLSSISCFSTEDETKTISSQSSYPATPFDEDSPRFSADQIFADQPLVEEPEDGLCCDGAVECKRSQSLKRAGYAMLWGPPNGVARSCSS